MSTSTRFICAGLAVVGLLGASTATAAAETANGGTVPLSMTLRACDFSVKQFVGTNGTGSGQATIGASGSTVHADITFATAHPNAAYRVRLIQGPRPASQTCVPSDPGVASAVMVTDGNGTGSVSLHDTVRQGATNAWVFIDGPTDIGEDVGEIRGDFYTTQNLVSLT